jgi:hypothetical protein
MLCQNSRSTQLSYAGLMSVLHTTAAGYISLFMQPPCLRLWLVITDPSVAAALAGLAQLWLALGRSCSRWHKNSRPMKASWWL